MPPLAQRIVAAGVSRVLNCEESRDVGSDFSSHGAPTGFVGHDWTGLDFRRDCPWWGINDQKNTGSCVGWAVADSVLRFHFRKVNKLTDWELLSPRFLWIASKEFDEYTTWPSTFAEEAGTSIKSALSVAGKWGCAKELTIPFEGGFYSGELNNLFFESMQFRINTYIRIHSIEDWKKVLLRYGPLAIRLEVDTTFAFATQQTSRLEKYQGASGGGHALAVVGYCNHGEVFILRNSWGTGWGDGGYAYATPAYLHHAITEAYAVIVDPNFRPSPESRLDS